VPITLALSVILGVWLMFAPSVLGGAEMVANSDRLIGALIVTVAAISTAEVVRAFRFLNLLFGIWLLIAPWALAGATSAGRWNDVVAGLMLLALTLPRGLVREKYARWDRWIV
jgi:hypothetical protein